MNKVTTHPDFSGTVPICELWQKGPDFRPLFRFRPLWMSSSWLYYIW